MGTTSRLLALLVIGTFVTSFVAAGHGVGPIGLLLVIGWGYWTPVLVLAWTSIVALFAGCLFYGRNARGFIFVGATLASVAWIAFLFMSDSALSTVVFSSHFLVAIILLFRHLYVHRPG